MKILIIGSKGMLGNDLVEGLAKTSFEVLGWGINDIDITKKSEMSKIKKEKPDVLINCAAYTNVDKAETEKEECYAVNVTGIKNLVEICKNQDMILFQISTDYVFNGDKAGYNEEDNKDPLNYYGKTKSEGEDIIIKNLSKYYLIRTSWLFGKNGKNFVDTIINLCSEKKEINVVNDQIGSPTFTVDLSAVIINILNNLKTFSFGIYHLTNDGVCSWFEFAQEIVRFKKLNCLVKPCTTAEFPREAKRPKCSILNNHKLEKVRHWKEALKEYLNDDNSNDYFKNYFVYNQDRSKVWKAITQYLSNFISDNDIVLEVGAGYCDFINLIKAKEKHALDIFPGIKNFAKSEVITYITSATNFSELDSNYFNVVFASNFFEHLDEKDFKKSLVEIKRVLKEQGKLIIIQPNYRYCKKKYFDDPTHKSIFSDKSLSAILHINGFLIKKTLAKFLPLTMKSKLPKSYLLTKIYLFLPIKPLAKQMLIIAEKSKC